jgi:hypothetical protein
VAHAHVVDLARRGVGDVDALGRDGAADDGAQAGDRLDQLALAVDM